MYFISIKLLPLSTHNVKDKLKAQQTERYVQTTSTTSNVVKIYHLDKSSISKLNLFCDVHLQFLLSF